ncbi:prokineticin-2 isoform X2 [Suricata suricatta]|uniref:Prokineticin 2 n=1 Tax=Suricata suricatta TaxID=37032 RepID=A0A673U9E6_SURSU|nr:prokineticin-2 isoform X2 [Suricata suricatta]
MRGPRCAPLLLLLLLPPLLLTPPAADAAVITGVQERKPFVTKMEFYHIGYLSVREVSRGRACDKDPQCGGGMCCAVSIWVKSIRICTPMGKVGDNCHPLTRKVPFFGRRMHHTCPCMPGLACLRTSFNRFTCLARK